jgi:UDP-glucose-4-epimerase GalE
MKTTMPMINNTKPHILVVGGAGYIGSHMCKYLARHDYIPVVLDSLVYGHAEAVRWGPFYKGSMENQDLVGHIFENHKIAAVMHFAAYCYVGESVTEPAKYYRNNVSNTAILLEEMIKYKIDNFIFSSSCATYGEPIEIPMTEDHPQNPVNPYGRTKLMVEQMLADFHFAYGIRHICLRYFNAAGADPECEIGEDHRPETHLIPLVLQAALGKREAISIFGDDYPTPDGTCIRDYIHVYDLAQAHLLALEKLLNGFSAGHYNLGNGEGHSVKEVIRQASKITGQVIPVQIVGRRRGDPAVLVGSSKKAIETLGWKPQFADLETIVETAWKWHKAYPEGYAT